MLCSGAQDVCDAAAEAILVAGQIVKERRRGWGYLKARIIDAGMGHLKAIINMHGWVFMHGCPFSYQRTPRLTSPRMIHKSDVLRP